MKEQSLKTKKNFKIVMKKRRLETETRNRKKYKLGF